MSAVVSELVATFFAEAPEQRFTAVKFRGKFYVAAPRHLDAINLAFAGMTNLQKHRVSNRIADGKEELLFGTTRGDGSDWEWNEEFQNARLHMYGFETSYPHTKGDAQ